jgi:hypothetical protein
VSRRRVSTRARPNSRRSRTGCCALWPIKKILDAERSETARMQSDSRRRSWSRTCCRRLTVCLARSKTPAGDDSLQGQGLRAGVAATERALRDVFVKHGIQKIQPAPGEPFDPHRHQALFEVKGGDYPAGTVAEILLPGYAYHERLLRPALVGVATSRAAQAPGRSE